MLHLPDRTRQAVLQLARASDFLLFVELHGTQEVPQLLEALLADLTALGYDGLGLEMPLHEQEPLIRWGSGSSDTVPGVFTGPPSDGRGNEQVLALIRHMVESGWQLLGFDASDDQPRGTWLERDSTMADNLATQWHRCCPGRKVVGVCGNLHSRLTPVVGDWPAEWLCLVLDHHRQLSSLNLLISARHPIRQPRSIAG